MNDQVDPRVPLLLAIALSIVLAVAERWETLMVGVALGVVLCAWRRPRLNVLVRRLIKLEVFLAILFVLLPVSWQQGKLSWNADRLALPMLIALRAHAIVFVVTPLIDQLGAAGLLSALRGLPIPPSLVLIATLSVRYLSLFQHEFRYMRLAMMSRGYRSRVSWKTYQAWSTLVGMLFLRSLDRAEQIRRSMAARNFARSTPSAREPLPPRSWLAVALGVSAVALLALIEWNPWDVRS